MSEDTPAIVAARAAGIEFGVVTTERATSAEDSADKQGIALHQLLKTIVVRRGEDDYVMVLVPGDRGIDWRKLRTHLGVSRLSLADRSEAERITGYKIGTITPFGSKAALPMVIDASAKDEELVALGAGAHGVNMHVAAADLRATFDAAVADVTSPS